MMSHIEQRALLKMTSQATVSRHTDFRKKKQQQRVLRALKGVFDKKLLAPLFCFAFFPSSCGHLDCG